MIVSEKLLALVKSFEGYSSTIYKCPAGKLTIGYGHVLKSNEREKYKNGITKEQAEALLKEDIKHYQKAVINLVEIPITEDQLTALVSFTYNVGIGAFYRSTLLKYVNKQMHDEVATEFMKWIFSNGNILKGLIKRRKLECSLYMSQIEQTTVNL